MSQSRGIIAALAVVWLATSLATGAAQPNAPAKSGDEVQAVADLLDTWSGQPRILEQARDAIARILKADPSNYRALKEMARYQMFAGSRNSREVRNGNIVYSVGTYSPGTLDAAEATLRQALRVNPRFAEAYVLLGHVQHEQMRLDEAAKSLAEAEALGTDDAWLHLNWASVLEARGEYSAAEERSRRVLGSATASAKQRVVAYNHLIESHARKGEHDRAIELYKEQIKLAPSNAWLRSNFANYLIRSAGRNDEAIAEARAALAIMDYGAARLVLASAFYGKWADLVAEGKDAEAEPYFRDASAVEPRLEWMMVYGGSYAAGGRLAKALSTKKGVSIDARGEDGSTALLIATNRNRAQVVRALLDLNANPNIADRRGWTPLISSADEGNMEIASLLLAKGADIRATRAGHDAVDHAERRGHSELAKMLKMRAAFAVPRKPEAR